MVDLHKYGTCKYSCSMENTAKDYYKKNVIKLVDIYRNWYVYIEKI